MVHAVWKSLWWDRDCAGHSVKVLVFGCVGIVQVADLSPGLWLCWHCASCRLVSPGLWLCWHCASHRLKVLAFGCCWHCASRSCQSAGYMTLILGMRRLQYKSPAYLFFCWCFVSVYNQTWGHPAEQSTETESSHQHLAAWILTSLVNLISIIIQRS